MTNILLVLVFAAILFGVAWFIKDRTENSDSGYMPSSPIVAPNTATSSVARQTRWPYVKKKYLMNYTEYEFFKALRHAIGDNYVIFAQVHLTKLVEIPKEHRQWQTFWNKIDRKSVDFVLCENAGVRPVLAIEVDGSGHHMKNRADRDQFVKEIFEQAHLKFMRFDAQRTYDVDRLRQEIRSKLI